ncbi:glycosyltransferase, partial [Oscillibacter sp. CAG:155]
SVGRLAAEKNLDELLRFRAAMGDQAVTLLLVGDGPYRSQLEREAAELGLRAPQVVFAGMVPPQQVAEWYQLGDLFVSASSSETQGLTYVEALAAGVPALCRADPCLDGVIRDGENGWQFRDFSDFMKKLDAFRTHPEQRQTLSKQAALSAKDYSAEEFARRVEAIYLAQIARRRGQEEVSA